MIVAVVVTIAMLLESCLFCSGFLWKSYYGCFDSSRRLLDFSVVVAVLFCFYVLVSS